jgi:hypothetical protein
MRGMPSLTCPLQKETTSSFFLPLEILQTLPKEILHSITSYWEPEDLCRLKRICKINSEKKAIISLLLPLTFEKKTYTFQKVGKFVKFLTKINSDKTVTAVNIRLEPTFTSSKKLSKIPPGSLFKARKVKLISSSTNCTKGIINTIFAHGTPLNLSCLSLSHLRLNEEERDMLSSFLTQYPIPHLTLKHCCTFYNNTLSPLNIFSEDSFLNKIESLKFLISDVRIENFQHFKNCTQLKKLKLSFYKAPPSILNEEKFFLWLNHTLIQSLSLFSSFNNISSKFLNNLHNLNNTLKKLHLNGFIIDEESTIDFLVASRKLRSLGITPVPGKEETTFQLLKKIAPQLQSLTLYKNPSKECLKNLDKLLPYLRKLVVFIPLDRDLNEKVKVISSLFMRKLQKLYVFFIKSDNKDFYEAKRNKNSLYKETLRPLLNSLTMSHLIKMKLKFCSSLGVGRKELNEFIQKEKKENLKVILE